MISCVGATTTTDNSATASEETHSPYDIGPSHTPEREPEPETNGAHIEEAPPEEPLETPPEPETETVKHYPTQARKPPQLYGH